MRQVCFLLFLVTSLAASAQPPGKLMCKPVTFTCWSEEINEYYDDATTISFWEDGSDAAYVYIKHISSGETEIIPMKREVEIRKDGGVYIYGDVKDMGLDDFYIKIPNEKVHVGSSAHDATIVLTTFTFESQFSSGFFYLEEPCRSIDIPVDEWDLLTKKCQKSIESFNSLVDYVNSIQSPSYNGFYRIKKD